MPIVGLLLLLVLHELARFYVNHSLSSHHLLRLCTLLYQPIAAPSLGFSISDFISS